MLQETLLSRYAQVVDQCKMLRVLVQANAAAVRDDGYPESGDFVRSNNTSRKLGHTSSPSASRPELR